MKVLVIQNNPDTPPSLVGDHLVAAGATLTTILPHNGDGLPATPEDFDGALILGGPQHAGDDQNYPAFPPMLDLLRAFHAEEKPLLGLCLGSQLLARAFGEKVRRRHRPASGAPHPAACRRYLHAIAGCDGAARGHSAADRPALPP